MSDGAPATGLPVRRRGETDGCGCLDCRDVDATAVRRGLLATLSWSVRLCRRYPSVLILGAVLVGLRTLLDTLGVQYLADPVLDLLEGTTALAFFFGLRAYVATLTARELTGDTLAVWPWCRRALGRLVALVAVVVLSLSVLTTLSMVVDIALVAGLVFAGVDISTQPVFLVVAAVGAVLLAVPPLVLLFKCWFAIDACVIGRYGPLESIRVSWAMTTTYRWKLVRLVGLVAVVLGVSYVDGVATPVSGPLGSLFPAVSALVGDLAELSAVVWFAVSAHLYVQSVVDIGSPRDRRRQGTA